MSKVLGIIAAIGVVGATVFAGFNCESPMHSETYCSVHFENEGNEVLEECEFVEED